MRHRNDIEQLWRSEIDDGKGKSSKDEMPQVRIDVRTSIGVLKQELDHPLDLSTKATP